MNLKVQPIGVHDGLNVGCKRREARSTSKIRPEQLEGQQGHFGAWGTQQGFKYGHAKSEMSSDIQVEILNKQLYKSKFKHEVWPNNKYWNFQHRESIY